LGLGFGVQDLGFRVQGVWVWDLGFRILGFRVSRLFTAGVCAAQFRFEVVQFDAQLLLLGNVERVRLPPGDDASVGGMRSAFARTFARIATHRNASQRNATQRNATQRIAS